jgi:hypothetical protein
MTETMKKFKSSTSRLVHFFQKSRDSWKVRSADKQKRIKALEIKVRDLTESRDYWKNKAKTALCSFTEAQNQCAEEPKKKKQTNEKANVIEAKDQEILLKTEVSKGHVYPVFVVQLALQQLIQGLASLRGCQLNFELFSPFFEFKLATTPSFSSIRNWLHRVGLYALTQPKVHRDDWILIPDFIAEFGKLRALVVLGISQNDFCASERVFRDSSVKPSFALRHQDVEILTVEILSNSTGVQIEEILTQLTEKIGSPTQIVADHGSDLKSGIERYQQKNTEVKYTHDVTHHLGILFKHVLENDAQYQQFCQKCGLTRSQIQQTDLHFLIPPSSQHKSRYLNVDKYVKWANQILVFKAKNDYSQISQVYSLDEKTYTTLAQEVDKKTLLCLQKLGYQTYANKKTFLDAVRSVLDLKEGHKDFDIICQATHLGKNQFIDRLGWLEDYQQELQFYTQMVEIAHQAFVTVKNLGLTKDSKKQFEQNLESLELLPQSQDFKQKVINYLNEESAKVSDDKTWLATSDVIESLFGKYKLLTSTSCLKELGKRILTLPLCTLSMTGEFVKNALESVSEKDVENWNNDVFGQSALSKRREAFSLPKPDTKVA